MYEVLNDAQKKQLSIENRLIEAMDANRKHISEEPPEKKKLKRELNAIALARLEDAARTAEDFKEVIVWWDRLDANRERRERYHEILRSGDALPLDYGASNGDFLNNVIEKQILKGEFIEAIFNCPYDIHELVTGAAVSFTLKALKDKQKELLYLLAIRQYSTSKVAALRGRTDRNIRKVRNTMLTNIRKKLYIALQGEADITLLEIWFLQDYERNVDAQKVGTI